MKIEEVGGGFKPIIIRLDIEDEVRGMYKLAKCAPISDDYLIMRNELIVALSKYLD